MSQGPRMAPQAPEATESCRECGAQMAADQRYCLNCGKRCGEPRLDDFRQHLPDAATTAANGHAAQAAVPTPAPGTPASGGEQKPQRDFTPLAAAGGIAVLGLMLLVGVLIGRGDGEQAAAPPPQVVRVQGGGEEGAGANDDGEGALEGAGVGSGKGKEKGDGKGAGASATAKAPPPEITADDSELEALEGQSPQEYSENSAKLPDEIATEGAPPPEDNKKPGGGSAGATIE